MKFEDLNYDELLNINAGEAKEDRNWLKIVGTGVFTIGATMASCGVIPAGAAIVGGVWSIANEL